MNAADHRLALRRRSSVVDVPPAAMVSFAASLASVSSLAGSCQPSASAASIATT